MFGDDERELNQAPAWKRIGIPALAVIFVSGGAFSIVKVLTSGGKAPRPHIEQHITAINLPPPPPPPPPPPEKPQEKPKEEQKVEQKIQQPKPQAPKIAAPQQLTATAGAGNDAYGLKAGEGGGDGSCVGDCGNGNDEQGPYFQSLVRGLVADALRGDDRLRAARYSGTVTFVFDQYGRVQNVNFENFDGDAETREAVIRALARVAASESIPPDMQNGKPWTVRIRAHAPG